MLIISISSFQLQSSFSMSCKSGLVVMNAQLLFVWETLYLSFMCEGQCCWVKYCLLKVFFCSILNVLSQYPLAFKVSEKSAD